MKPAKISICITESDSFYLSMRMLMRTLGAKTLPHLVETLIERTHERGFYSVDLHQGNLIPVIADRTHRNSIRIGLPPSTIEKLNALTEHYATTKTKLIKALVGGAINRVNP